MNLECSASRSAWYARAATVSRLPDPPPTILCRVGYAAGCERPLPNDDDDYASTTSSRADSSEDFGDRRANAGTKRAGVPPPQIGFEARRRLQVVEDARRGIRFWKIRTWDCERIIQTREAT